MDGLSPPSEPTAPRGAPKYGSDPEKVATPPARALRVEPDHLAPLGPELPAEITLRCIAAGCRPGGTVLDPFSGTATTGLAALRLGRRYIGIDINPAYHELARRRLLAIAGRAAHPPGEPA
jgi:hypothetical protein